MNVGSSPESLQLIARNKKQDIKKCSICQNSKGKWGTKLTSTEAGWNHIIEATKIFKDDLILGMFEEDVKNIQYHTCYANYRKRKEELNLKQYSHSSSANFFPNNGSHVACLHLAVQKVPRQLTLQCHMKKVAFL